MIKRFLHEECYNNPYFSWMFNPPPSYNLIQIQITLSDWEKTGMKS